MLGLNHDGLAGLHGWVARTVSTDMVLDAFEQSLSDRPLGSVLKLVHHRDGGVQHLSIRYTVRRAEPGIDRGSAAAETRMTLRSPSP